MEPPPRPPRAAHSRQPATILDLALDLPIMGKLILRTVGGTARLIESDCR
ncbi:hypothetical protein BURPS668_A0406 [Burkholderia pseudomallei 668]|nr:hypothetical protein BURPS668_A0406 [Burkholderia pseudomallei 668]